MVNIQQTIYGMKEYGDIIFGKVDKKVWPRQKHGVKLMKKKKYQRLVTELEEAREKNVLAPKK